MKKHHLFDLLNQLQLGTQISRPINKLVTYSGPAAAFTNSGVFANFNDIKQGESMKFLKQDSVQTLQEGLNELYANAPEVHRTSVTKGKFFQDHDLTHVLFGCDTSIYGELDLKAWILFGTNISTRELRDYANDEEVQKLNKEGEALLGGKFLSLLKIIFVFLPQFFMSWLLRVRKMKKKWPHSQVTEKMMSQRLCDLRDEYGIKIIVWH